MRCGMSAKEQYRKEEAGKEKQLQTKYIRDKRGNILVKVKFVLVVTKAFGSGIKKT